MSNKREISRKFSKVESNFKTVLTPPSTIVETLAEPRRAFGAAPPENRAQSVEAELALWLAALGSFLQTENLPANQDASKQNQARNWNGEVRIVAWCLLRCSQLVVNPQIGQAPTLTPEQLGALQKMLQERFALAESLSAANKVDSLAWNAWRAGLADELNDSEAALKLRKRYEAEKNGSLPQSLRWIEQHPDLNGVLGCDVREVFGRLFGMLERLQLVHEMLKHDQPLKPSLLLFALLKQETGELLEMVERILQFAPADSLVYEILDGFAYVTPMELRKVYEHELVGVSELRQAPAIFASVENSCGLLRDSFQQAVVALAQVYAPDLAAAAVFPNQQTKLEQSLALRHELWTLLKFVQTIEKSLEPATLARLNQRLANFRQNAMLFLMFKDFETTERFIEEIARTERNEEVAQVLHRFGAYLETLLSQVNMRNILANSPFDYPEVSF